MAIGDSVMTFVQRNPNLSVAARIEGADTAAGYAARDPLMHLGRGGVYLAAADEEQNELRLTTALAELRMAAKLTPEDYRVWLSLGRVLDRDGKQAEARAAFDRAVQLAPRHFDTRWAFGNHWLRAGQREAAFAQFREALTGRPSALPLVFDYAWDAFQGDGKAIAAAVAPAGEAKVQLIVLLIARNRIADAVAIWREMPNRTEAQAQQITTALFHAGKMAAAYEAWSSVQMAERPAPDAGSLLANGDFEKPLVLNSGVPFLTWRIPPIGGVRVTLDRKEPHAGRQSLRISLDVGENVPFTPASQTLVVKSSKSYLLKFAFRTEELHAWGTTTVEVVDAADPGKLRAAAQLPNGDKDWTEQEIPFTTAAITEAVTVRLQRQPCGDPPCASTGRVWLDTFKLTEAGQ